MANQPYMPSIGAPSSIPKHLHFVRDPLKHNTVALKIANDNQARIHPITWLYYYYYYYNYCYYYNYS